MNQGKITCPQCGHEFELSDALTHQIRDHLKSELQADVVKREAEAKRKLDELKVKEEALATAKDSLNEEIEKQLKLKLSEAEAKAAKKVEGQFAGQLKELQTALGEKDESIKTFRENELNLRRQQRELEQAKESLNEEIEKQLKQKLSEAEAKAAKKVEGQFAGQLKELQTALGEKDESIKTFRENELDLRKKQRELEQAKENAELDLQRKLDEERLKIRQETEGKVQEQHRLKDLEREKVINDLKSALEDMKRKADQGSMETQGEVLEQDFEAQLKRYFVHDDIQPVPKGIRGADLIQTVRTPLALDCGVLLWELKNTKGWSAQWIPKLKDDMIETRATIAILISVVLPEGVNRFGMVDGIWVCDPLSAIPLAVALRQQLLVLDRERRASVGKNEKMEMVYLYLAGTEFKQKIEGIVEAFTAMQDQVKGERRAMEKHWKEREKQIERVIKNTVGLYGDMQGIIGGSIPLIPALELDYTNPKVLPESTDEPSSEE